MGFGVVDREPRPLFMGVAEREPNRTALSSVIAAAEIDDESRICVNCPNVDVPSEPSSLAILLEGRN